MSLLGKLETLLEVLRTEGVKRALQLTARKLSGQSISLPQPQVNEGGAGVVGLIDVGSVGGLAPEWRSHASKIKFLLNFEPRDNPIRTESVITTNTALWSELCVRDFYIYKGLRGSGSSLFMQNYYLVLGIDYRAAAV